MQRGVVVRAPDEHRKGSFQPPRQVAARLARMHARHDPFDWPFGPAPRTKGGLTPTYCTVLSLLCTFMESACNRCAWGPGPIGAIKWYQHTQLQGKDRDCARV